MLFPRPLHKPGSPAVKKGEKKFKPGLGLRQVHDAAPKDRDIAMVFQNHALYPHMTVYDKQDLDPLTLNLYHRYYE